MKLDVQRHARWERMAHHRRSPGTRAYTRFGDVVLLPNGKRVRTQIRFPRSTVHVPIKTGALRGIECNGPRREAKYVLRRIAARRVSRYRAAVIV